MSIISVSGMHIDIPDEYQILKLLPGDPEGAVPIGSKTIQSENFVLFMPIIDERYIPQGELTELISKTRRTLGSGFGLVEVGEGITQSNTEYVYRILKMNLKPNGVQYQLTMQLYKNGNGVLISGYFDEAGTTGIREVMVFDLLRRKGKISEDMENWTADPYDKSVTSGFLMNRSEQKQYDDIFPEHPLTVVRNLIKHLTGNDDAEIMKKVS